MDPLSIASGVAGFLALVLQIAEILRKDVRTIRDAPKEARELVEKLETLAESLEFLNELVQKNSTLVQNSVLLANNSAAQSTKDLTLTALIAKGTDMLTRIKDRALKLQGGGIPGAKARLKWFLDQELLREAGTDLQRLIVLFGQCKSFEGM
jgi:hypothetical protein